MLRTRFVNVKFWVQNTQKPPVVRWLLQPAMTGFSWSRNFHSRTTNFLRTRFVLLLEMESSGVHAVSLSCRLWSIIEDMPEMPSAASAYHLGSLHPKAPIRFQHDSIVWDSRKETRPSASWIKFGLRGEQLVPASGAHICSFGGLMNIFSVKRRLCSFLAQHQKLLSCEGLFPFVLRFFYCFFLSRFVPPIKSESLLLLKLLSNKTSHLRNI